MALLAPAEGESTDKPRWHGDNKAKSGIRPLKEEPVTVDPDANLKKLVQEGRVDPAVLQSTEKPAIPQPEPGKSAVSFASTSSDVQRAPADVAVSAPSSQALTTPMVSTQGLQNAYQQEANAIAQGQAETDKTYKAGIEKLDALDKETNAEIEATKLADDEMKTLKALQAEQAKMKPEARDYFSGKTTFQKIMAGVGLALASLTPQGAQNAIKIIDSEIDRDLDLQKFAYEQKGKQIEEVKGNYKAFMDKFKDARLARMAAKSDMIQRLKLDLDAQAQKTASQQAKAKLGQLSQLAVIEGQKAELEFQKLSHAINKELAEGKVPGWKGQAKDPVAARDFKKAEAEGKMAISGLNELLKINDKGWFEKTFSPTTIAKADSTANRLIGQLRVAVTGPGSMSEGDRALLETVIANPTKFFSLASSNKVKLEELKAAVTRKINADAHALGLYKEEVGRPL
jgi:hypothetical protein